MNHLVEHDLNLLRCLVNSRKKSEETKRAIDARTMLVRRHIELYRKFTFSLYCQNMAESIKSELDKILRGE